jgi:hypothetical protein
MATTGARSIAKDISRREPPRAPDGEDFQAHEEQRREDAQADEEQPDLEADEEPESQADDEQPALVADEQSDPQADEEQPPSVEADEESDDQADEEQPDQEADAQSDARADDEQSDFEANMYELQADLGEEWVLHFSVQGDDGWLTAEKQDGTQRVEAPDAQRLVTIIDAIDECGGRRP